MKRNAYYPARHADQLVWLANFANKLPGSAAVLGLTPAQVNGAVADCNWLLYVLQTWLPAVRNWAQSGTDAATDTIVRPADYNASTNAKVWKQVF